MFPNADAVNEALRFLIRVSQQNQLSDIGSQSNKKSWGGDHPYQEEALKQIQAHDGSTAPLSKEEFAQQGNEVNVNQT